VNPCAIIIPVFNGYEFVRPCIESVLRNSPQDCPIVVVDDASTDQQTIDYLDGFNERVLLAIQRPNKGFVRTVNDSLRVYPGRDILILNSDTIVPPGWVERMQNALYCEWVNSVVGKIPVLSKRRIAAVCPLSNSAMHVSVPNSGENHLPKWLTVDEMDRIVNETSDHCYPELPTIHGFCMLLSREAINELGGFDRAFGKGYGEETDWSLRAHAAGWKILAVDDLFVWHKEHASFGERRKELAKHAERVLLDRYPDYPEQVRSWWNAAPLRAHKMRIFDRLRPRPAKKRIRVLYLVHNWEGLGGLETYSRRLMQELGEDVEYSVIYPTRCPINHDAYIDTEANGVYRIQLAQQLTETPVWVCEFPLSNRNLTVEHWFSEVLDGLRPDIVHFHHLAGFGSFELPQIAGAHGCKVLLSACDDFFVCPLLRLGGECTKSCVKADSECLACLKSEERLNVHEPTLDTEILDILAERLHAVRNMGLYCDRIEVPSQYLKRTYDEIWGGRVEVVPLGIPVDPVVNLYHKSDKLRVGWFGAGTARKGFGAFCEAARHLKDRMDIEWHVVAEVNGTVDTSGLEHVKFHGPFADGQLGTWLQTIDVAVVAAMRNETYGSIIDEVVAHGCLVIVAAVPAIQERHCAILGTLLFYDWGSAESLECALNFNFNLWCSGLLVRRPTPVKSFASNAADYLRIYRELLGEST
jgi:GT2 family glycosyltransferase